MGWLWSSSKEPSTSKPTSSTSTSTSSEPFTPPNTSSPPPPPPPPQDLTVTPPSPTHAHGPSTTPLPTTPTSSSRTPITPTTTLPSTLSCRTAFDTAFYCQSFGGQFSNIYRYGSLRNCSSLWGDFWFCVRTNRGFKSEERKQETIRAWALRREMEKYGGGGGDDDDGEGGDGGGTEEGVEKVGKGSSEDVWEARRWKVRGAFGGDWVGVEREVGEKVDLEMQKEVR